MTHPHNETDARIDHVLNALRDTETDARIDHILNALRDTAPSPSLNARIADRIAERRLSITDSRTSSPSPFAVMLNAVKEAKTVATAFFAVILTLSLPKGKDPRILFAEAPLYTLAAVSLAILAALSLTVFHSHRPTTTQSRISASVIQPQSSAQNPEASAARKPNTSAGSTGAALQSRHHVNTAPAPHPLLVRATIRAKPHSQRLVSFPAPPMPLTKQEKLLQRVARTDNPQVLAMLNPTLRAQQEAKEKEEFEKFAGISNTPDRN